MNDLIQNVPGLVYRALIHPDDRRRFRESIDEANRTKSSGNSKVACFIPMAGQNGQEVLPLWLSRLKKEGSTTE